MRNRLWEETRQNFKSDEECWDAYFQFRDEWCENFENE